MIHRPSYARLLLVIRISLGLSLAWLLLRGDATAALIVGVFLALYFMFDGGAVPERRTVALGTSVFTLGVTAGTYWEIFERATGARYTITDTVIDLIVDSADALVAALVALGTNPRGERH